MPYKCYLLDYYMVLYIDIMLLFDILLSIRVLKLSTQVLKYSSTKPKLSYI